MSSPRPDPDAAALLRRLHEARYFDLLSLLGENVLRPFDWEKMAPKLSGDTLAIWRFFLLGEKLPRGAARRLLGEPALRFLASHKLCRVSAGRLSLGTLSLIGQQGGAVFVDRQAPPKVFLGNDTRALLSLVRPLTEGACLCLHPASGAEVLPLIANPATSVDLARVDSHPGIIEATLRLNAIAPNWRFLKSERACRSGGYQLVMGSLPSYFEIPGLKLPPTVAAGPDGRDRVREALVLAAKVLAPAGELVVTFVWFAEPDVKVMEQGLRALADQAGLAYSLLVSSKLLMEPGLPVFNQMAILASKVNRRRPEVVFDKMLRHIKRRKFGAAYLVRGRFWRPSRRSCKQLIDFSELYYGGWTF